MIWLKPKLVNFTPLKKGTAGQKKAFTLVELIFIVAIIGILGAVTIGRLGGGGLIERYTVYTATHQIAADLRLARRLAVTTADDHRVEFLATGGSSDFNQYQVQRDNSGSWDMIGEAKSIADSITVLDNDATVTFSPDGSADASYTLRYQFGSDNYRLLISENTGAIELEEY